MASGGDVSQQTPTFRFTDLDCVGHWEGRAHLASGGSWSRRKARRYGELGRRQPGWLSLMQSSSQCSPQCCGPACGHIALQVSVGSSVRAGLQLVLVSAATLQSTWGTYPG